MYNGTHVIVEHEHFTLSIEFTEGLPFFHFDLRKWSKDLYKTYLSIFGEVLTFLKDKGFNEVYVVIPKDEKLLKFETMFGFKILDDSGERYIMVQEI